MDLHQISSDNSTINVAFTDVSDGNFQIDSDSETLTKNRARIIDLQWSWVRQIHSNTAINISQPVGFAGDADALITKAKMCPISVTTADCVPVVLVASDQVGVVHAGWRGLESGIIGVVAEAMRSSGSSPFKTLLGPHIDVANYEFSEHDLSRLVEAISPSVAGTTSSGSLGLDLYQGVLSQCSDLSLPAPDMPETTATDKYFSHRLRQQDQRQATVAWISPNDS